MKRWGHQLCAHRREELCGAHAAQQAALAPNKTPEDVAARPGQDSK